VRISGPPDLVASSPFTRALDTARIVAGAFGIADGAGWEPEVLQCLVPDGEPAELLPWLSARSGTELVLLAGHEPQLGRLACFLLAPPGGSFLQLKKAGACLLELEDEPRPGCARLLWLLPPAQLRRLGRASGRPGR
jgi:phosphohistidine phosphatase